MYLSMSYSIIFTQYSLLIFSINLNFPKYCWWKFNQICIIILLFLFLLLIHMEFQILILYLDILYILSLWFQLIIITTLAFPYLCGRLICIIHQRFQHRRTQWIHWNLFSLSRIYSQQPLLLNSIHFCNWFNVLIPSFTFLYY